ncbi:MAG: hypothetical protein FK733_01580 [Asgard group archaeon]|nr:hypothetical protein [Asgard group archaeon]
MSEQIIERGQTIELDKVNGNLKIGKDATIIAKNKSITVNGSIVNRGGFVCEGSLVARNIRVKNGSAEILGNLELQQYAQVDNRLDVNGSVICPDISVGGSLYIETDIQSDSVKVGGTVKIGNKAQVETIKTGGTLKIFGESNVGSITVGGTVKLLQTAQIDSIKVGGTVKVTGGRFAYIKIGGSFKSTEKVEINSMDIGGTVKAEDDVIIEDLSVGGSFTAGKNLQFGRIDIGGTIKIYGNATGKTLKVGGTISCQENLTCEEKLLIGGSCIVEKVIDAQDIEVGGKIVAKFINAKYFKIKRRGEVSGTVNAEIIIVSSRATADDLYGKDIRIEENARVRNVYGDSITLEEGARVSGEILYTSDFYAEDGVKAKEAQKVDALPSPKAK